VFLHSIDTLSHYLSPFFKTKVNLC